MIRALAIALLCACNVVAAATGAYDESADAPAEISSALRSANRSNTDVLVVFGANWCGDCKVLDQWFKSGKVSSLIAAEFTVVKVDVGRFDRNVAIATQYGVPLKQGIPAVAVLDASGRLKSATRAGELADARKMGEDGILAFFTKLAARPN